MSGRQPAAALVAQLLSVADYFLWKNHHTALAESWRESSPTLPATIEVPTADDIWSAASLKGRFPVAYADGFAAALARKYNCPLVTGDPEFRRVDQLELDWIGGSGTPQ